jgi:hypothetical protein
MHVYLVVASVPYEGSEVLGAFSSDAAAQSYIDAQGEAHYDLSIQAWEVED